MNMLKVTTLLLVSLCILPIHAMDDVTAGSCTPLEVYEAPADISLSAKAKEHWNHVCDTAKTMSNKLVYREKQYRYPKPSIMDDVTAGSCTPLEVYEAPIPAKVDTPVASSHSHSFHDKTSFPNKKKTKHELQQGPKGTSDNKVLTYATIAVFVAFGAFITYDIYQTYQANTR